MISHQRISRQQVAGSAGVHHQHEPVPQEPLSDHNRGDEQPAVLCHPVLAGEPERQLLSGLRAAGGRGGAGHAAEFVVAQ